MLYKCDCDVIVDPLDAHLTLLTALWMQMPFGQAQYNQQYNQQYSQQYGGGYPYMQGYNGASYYGAVRWAHRLNISPSRPTVLTPDVFLQGAGGYPGASYQTYPPPGVGSGGLPTLPGSIPGQRGQVQYSLRGGVDARYNPD